MEGLTRVASVKRGDSAEASQPPSPEMLPQVRARMLQSTDALPPSHRPEENAKIPKCAERSARTHVTAMWDIRLKGAGKDTPYVESPPKWSALRRLRRGDGLDCGYTCPGCGASKDLLTSQPSKAA